MSGRPITKGTTNVSSVIRIIDSADGTPETGVTSATGGLAFNYRRELEAAVAITAVNDLALLTTAHADGGLLHIGDGYYRIDFQDAAFAAGAAEDGVLLTGTATGMIVIGTYHPLVDYDPYDAVRMGLTALPNAAADAANGLLISVAGSLDMDAMNVNVNDIETDTAAMQPLVAKIPLSDGVISWNATALAAINAECDTAMTDYDAATGTEIAAITGTSGVLIGTDAANVTEIEDAVWDALLTGAAHNNSTSAGRRLRQIDAAFVVTEGTADAGSTSTTINLETGIADAVTDNIYSGDRVMIVGGTGAGEHGLILSYASSTQIATMSKAWVITPDATSEYILVPADCDVELWNDNAITGDGDWAALKAETVLIVADTNELQTDWTNAGRLDLILDIIAVDTTTDIPALIATAQADLDIITGADGVNLLTATQASIDAIETDTGTTLQAELDAIQAAVITNATGVDIAADIIALKAETVLIVADTGELQTDWVNGGRLDLIVDIIAADTTTDIPALLTTAQADLDTLTGSDGVTLATAQGNYAPAKAADVWSDSTPPAGTAMSRAVDGIVLGTASGVPTTTSIPTSSLVPAAIATDQFKGRIVTFDDATTTTGLRGQSTDITASTSGGVLTVTALTNAPASGDTFTIQ